MFLKTINNDNDNDNQKIIIVLEVYGIEVYDIDLLNGGLYLPGNVV